MTGVVGDNCLRSFQASHGRTTQITDRSTCINPIKNFTLISTMLKMSNQVFFKLVEKQYSVKNDIIFISHKFKSSVCLHKSIRFVTF